MPRMSQTQPEPVVIDDERDYCPTCGAEYEYADCWQCHGAGGWDAHELDPITEESGAWERCDECRGSGKLASCPDGKAHESQETYS